jgi:gamma-glutamyltranspeptidase/glutathione hydrolase
VRSLLLTLGLRTALPSLALLLAACALAPPTAPASSVARGAVATETAAATRAALACLDRGGSAADAAVVAALVAGVVSPVSSGLGGGGFALIREGASGRVTALDFRESAPAAYDPDAASAPQAPPGLSVGVPGEVAGLVELHRRWGRRPWRENVEAARQLATKGFEVTPHTARFLARVPQLRPAGTLGSLFAPGGSPLTTGATVKIPALGATLEALGERGAAGFYEGAVARAFVGAARGAGSGITEQDLATYRVIERAPLKASWGEYEVHTMPPPSAGGLMLLTTLGMIDPAEARGLDPTRPEGAHLLAEIFRGSLADRFRHVGDPAGGAGVEALLEPGRLAARRRGIDPGKTRAVEAWVQEDKGTSHLVIVDGEQNVVSLTTTVNSPWGSRLYAEDAGVLLNDELNDFLPRARAEALGLPGAPGVGRPGARPPSSMTPTVVLRGGKLALAAGGSGGMRIATSVTQVTLGVLAGLGVDEAIRRPRVHVTPDGALLLEPGAVGPEGRADLERRGERVKEEEAMNAVQGVRLWPAPEAAADGRKFGKAALQGSSGP